MSIIYKSLRLLSLIILLLAGGEVFATTYYFSQSTGSDANAGTSTGAPKKSIGAALGLMGSGNVLKFKRGDAWYLPLNTLDLVNKSNFTIDAYDSGAQPIIAGMVILPNSKWVSVGGNHYKFPLDSTGLTLTDIFRVVVNGKTKLDLHYDNGKTNVLSSLTSTSQYYYDSPGRALYLYGTSAPQNVEIIPASSALPAGIATVNMRFTDNVTIRNIDIRGGSKWNIIFVQPPCTNITIDNCTIERASTWGSGILVGKDTVSTEYNFNITITNNVVDKSFTTYENNTTQYLSGDGIFFLNAVDSGLVKGNTVRNWGHVGISLTSYAALSPSIHGVHRVTVQENDVSADSSGYMHGLDVSGFPGLTTLNVIKQNNFHNYTTTCHLQGSNNFFFSNIFNTVTVTTHLDQSRQPFGADVTPWRRSLGLMESRDNWIVNNTFANTGRYSLWVGWGDSAMPFNPNVTNIKIANNIFYNYGLTATTPLGLDIDSSVTGTNYYRNNNFWNGSSSAVVAKFKSNTFYNAAAFNGALGCTTDCSNNSQLNPQFVSYFVLGPGAADTLKTKGIDYTPYIYPYVPAAKYVDYPGVPWRTGNPSRGAVQF